MQNAVAGIGLLIAAVSALGVAGVGPRRLDTWVQWWLTRTPGLLRGGCRVGIALGGLRVYAAAQAARPSH